MAPLALALHGKGDGLDLFGGLVGVEAGQGVPVPPAHPGEVQPVVLQRLLHHSLHNNHGFRM